MVKTLSRLVLWWWWRLVAWRSERWLSLLDERGMMGWCWRREGRFKVKKVVVVFGCEGEFDMLQVFWLG